MTSSTREKVCKMFFEEKKRCEDIARELGVTIDTVYYHIREQRKKMQEKENAEAAHRKKVVTMDGLIERAIRIFDASWEAYEMSKRIVGKETVLRDGERFDVYVCKPNGKLAGDSRFLDICIKANAQLYVFYSGNHYYGIGNDMREPKELVSAEKVLETFINENKMIKVSAEVVKSEALKDLDLKGDESNAVQPKQDTSNADSQIQN